jgi:hypothetical protein
MGYLANLAYNLYLPDRVEVSYSLDGNTYSEPHTIKIMTDNDQSFKRLPITLDEEAQPARYIHIRAYCDEPENAIMMLDEVVVN